jgi:glycosyltransferase involved in cell wall biosynthesis
MKIAILTTDSREHFADYGNPTPYFGTAPQGLLFGFAELGKAAREKLKDETGKLKGEASEHSTLDVLHSTPVEIHVISCTHQPMRSPEKLADNIWFHSLHVPKWGWLKTGYLGCILAVRKKLRKIHPDLVHAQGTERDCAMSAVFTPYPKLLTIHGNLRLISKTVQLRPFMWFQSLLEGFVVPRFDGIVCITSFTKQFVEREAKKTWVVPNAVDPTFLALGEKRERLKDETRKLKVGNIESVAESPTGPPIILVVGTIYPLKNQNAFICALDSLATEKHFLVKFFGHRDEEEYGREFQSFVTERPWCHYGGMIGRDELREEFANATMLALPTLEDNCPMVVLEAMASGVPVVASKVGGVPDLIEDGRTGLLFNPLEPASMCHSVDMLLNSPMLRMALAETAKKQALIRFAPKVIAQRHLEIYREVLQK